MWFQKLFWNFCVKKSMTIVLQMNHAKTCLTPIILYLILTKMCMRMWCRQEQVTEKTRIHNRCVELSHIKMTTRNEWKWSESGDKKRQRILRCSVFSSFLNYSVALQMNNKLFTKTKPQKLRRTNNLLLL